MAVTINIPSQVKTYANLAAFPASGSLKTIYIAEDTNKTYRWTGSVYVEISGADFSGYVPTSRTLTINGTTQDLSANRTFTIPTDLTVGTTPISSGTNGRVLFQGTGNVLQQSSSLFWDNVNQRAGLGTSTPAQTLDVNGNTQITGNLIFPVGERLIQYGTSSFFAGRDSAGVYLAYGFGSQQIDIGSASTGNIRLRTTANVILDQATSKLLIGTTTDAGFKLDVNGTARVSGNLTLKNVTDELLFANATVKIRRVSDKLSLEGYAGFDFVDTNTSFTRMVINAAGNVGIGTSTPTSKLEVKGTGDVVYLDSNGVASRVTLKLNTTSASYTQIVGNGTEFNLATAGSTPITFGTNSAERARFAATTGNLLINTTTDAGYKLDVNGTARVVGQLYSTIINLGGNGNTLINYASNSINILAVNTVTSDIQFSPFRQVNINNTGSYTAQASAITQIDSTTKGFLPPRMTTTQKNAIASPATGLQVYDTTLNQMSYYNGTTWTNI